MAIHIEKLSGILHYWRKIPNFESDKEKLNESRFILTIYGLDINIYNRTWSTDLVESVRELFESGKSTQEITDYVLSQYPAPVPYQLSVFLRMILPLKIRIYAAALEIGNERMPAFLVFRAESISGIYTLFPQMSPQHSIKSYLDLDILTFSLKSVPCSIKETEHFKKSMINIYNRAHRPYQIVKAENIELHILTDLYGLYVLQNNEDVINKVTEQPQMIIDATFLKSSTIHYGPYMDKLRRYFMEFFAPFVFNDSIFYPEAKKRIKYWVVNLNFPDGSTIEMPFEIEQENPKDQEKEKSKGCLKINIGKKSQCQMYIPQFIESVDENKFQLSSIIKDIKLTTSLPDLNDKKPSPPILSAETLDLKVNYFYPEIWNDPTKMSIFACFQTSTMVLAPYHIEYLTHLGTDFSSYYPYLTEEETIHTFFPYAYYLKMVFEDLTIKLFSEPFPKYESFYEPDRFPHAQIMTDNFSFALALPLLHFQEKDKYVSFNAEMDRAKVNFYLPENHLMRIRRGPQEHFPYDYVSMDKFQLVGSYRWSSDPTGDCQIPISILIKNVDGLITIGTLVNLIGTIANYTSREKHLPKNWETPKKCDIYKYINNTSATVKIEKGTVKVPLDLYEPNDGAIAHASNILIGIEGYHPFWHVMVDIGCAVVELPRTNFPYDTYFNENFQTHNGPKEGTFHVEYIHITMKTISTFTGNNYIDVHTKIGCEIGNIDGFCVMPQLFCGLEIAWNIIHTFFSDDTSTIRNFDPFYIYKVEVFRICIGSIRVYLDMGTLGLVCAMLPGGVVVYSDTLIDENAHYVIFVHLPSIDAHILQYNEQDGKLHAIFRASTYLNVVRDIKFHGNPKEDAIRQNQLLRMYDIIPHPERFVGGSKRNYYTYLFDFINKDKSQISSEYFYVPEMMRQETYHSSLNEDYELASIYVSDSRNDDHYTLMIPELRYPTYKKLINMEDGIQWLHHYETVRFYNHLSSTNMNLINIPPANPIAFATQFYKDDKFRARDSNGAIRLVLPNYVTVQLIPTALINVSALLNAFNLFPNEELMAKVVRSAVGDDFDLKNYHSNTINVILPQVRVLIHDESFRVALTVDNVNIRSVTTLTKTLIEDSGDGKDKNVSVVFDTNLTLYIKDVTLECSNPLKRRNSIMAIVPEIRLVKVNDNGAAKIDPIKFNFGPDSPSILNAMIQTLPKYLEDLSIPAIGDRCEELIRCIKSDPRYKKELNNIKKHMYSPGECNTRYKVNCELSALYSTLRMVRLHNFTELYRFVIIPPKPVSHSHLLMNVDLPTIILSIQANSHTVYSNEPTLLLTFAPLVIESQSELTSISGGIMSLGVALSNDIIRFIKEIIPKSTTDQKKKKKKMQESQPKIKEVKRKSKKKVLNDFSDGYYDNNESSIERNTVAEADESNVEEEEEEGEEDNNEEEEEEEEASFEAQNSEEAIKTSDVLFKPKRKSSDSKIHAHFVVNSISIAFNELSVKLDNISLALAVQLSQILSSSITASFSNFDVSVNKWVSLKLKGISLMHDGQTGEGFIHIKPITFYIYLDFIINAQNYVDLSFINDILSEEDNPMSSLSGLDNPLETILSARQLRSINSNINNSPVTNRNEILEILKRISTSFLIDPLSVVVAISSKNRAEIVFPRALGFMFTANDNIHALCFFQKAEFIAKNFFDFPFPCFIFDLVIQSEDLQALLLVDDIDAVGNSKQLSNAASLVNEILSKFDKPNKKANKASSPRRSPSYHSIQSIEKKKDGFAKTNGNSKLNINFNLHLLKVEINVEELSTVLTITGLKSEVKTYDSMLFWKFNASDIHGKVFDSDLYATVSGSNSKIKKELQFTVDPLRLVLTHNLFNKIPLFASFASVILQGFSKQKHVNTFLHQLNDNFKQQIESHTENILNENSNEKLSFPIVLSSSIIFAIKNIDFQLLLPPSGYLLVTVPVISLDVKSKSSPLHSKQAIGAKFQIQDFDLIFDTDECLSAPGKIKKNHNSSLHIAQFIISALVFQNDYDFESVVDGLKIKTFPTIPSAISKLLLAMFVLTANINKAKDQISQSIQDLSNSASATSNSGNVSPVKPRKSSLLTYGKRPVMISSPNKVPYSPRQISSIRISPVQPPPEKIITTIITGLFECTNTEINLSPIDNKLQIPSIEFRFMLMNNDKNPKDNNLDVSLFIPDQIEASLTPALIDYIGQLKTIIPVLSKESQLQMQEKYVEKQKELNTKLKKKKLKANNENLKATSPIKSSHRRSKSFNSNTEIVEDDDDIFKFSSKLSFDIHVTVRSEKFQIRFSCQPRRNDVACLIGISGISAVASTQFKCLSVRIVDFYFHTDNMIPIQKSDRKNSRLFQFNIPRIDLLLGMSKIMLDIEEIFSSFSSYKVEEITLFNDIWIQPLLKMISSTDDNELSNSNRKPDMNGVSTFKYTSENNSKIIEYESDDDDGFSINNNSNMSLVSQDESNATISSNDELTGIFKLEIIISIKSIKLFFNYAAGKGNIDFIFQPIYLSRTPELIYAAINTISCKSVGQLALTLDAYNLFFISANTSSSLMNVIHINDIKTSMSMAGDTFLLFSVYQINLLCRIKKEETGDKNTILELSIDTPQIKMTALTVPTLKTLIKTITEPIINGVARANRSEPNLELSKSRSTKGKSKVNNDNFKTAPVLRNNKHKNSLVHHLLFAKLSVVIRDFRIVLLRYVFRDNDAVMLSIDAAMLHLDLKPKGKRMDRNLHFSFLPTALVRLTNNEIMPNATNPAGFMPSSSDSLSKQSKSKSKNSKSKDKKNSNANEIEKAKLRPILKIPQVNGTLDTQQKIVYLPDVTYNFYTEFNGYIEPSLNLTDYEMLLKLIQYTIANANLNNTEDDRYKSLQAYGDDDSDSNGFLSSISSNNQPANRNNDDAKNNQNNGGKSKNLGGKNTDDDINKDKGKNKQKEKVEDNMPKIHYNFTPLNYQFAPSFKVGYGAPINPDVTWLLARFGISDEHIIPASLFQFLCIGLENFLSALTNSMTKANQEDETK